MYNGIQSTFDYLRYLYNENHRKYMRPLSQRSNPLNLLEDNLRQPFTDTYNTMHSDSIMLYKKMNTSIIKRKQVILVNLSVLNLKLSYKTL